MRSSLFLILLPIVQCIGELVTNAAFFALAHSRKCHLGLLNHVISKLLMENSEDQDGMEESSW